MSRDSRQPLVVKFGGTSLGSPARVRRAARRVVALARRHWPLVVVVSARGQTTDRILKDLASVGAEGAHREVDRALATGEDLSAALLSAALNALGRPARSLRGGEAGVAATGSFGGGAIEKVDASRLRGLLDRGVIPVVSGFQGERLDRETVTLGRGGSDTSAVAIAAALGAPCDIVTDVRAVYDRDPREDARARPYTRLTHDELLALTERGAQVVHPGAARLALSHGVPLRVYSYRAPLHGPSDGTRIDPGVGKPAALLLEAV